MYCVFFYLALGRVLKLEMTRSKFWSECLNILNIFAFKTRSQFLSRMQTETVKGMTLLRNFTNFGRSFKRARCNLVSNLSVEVVKSSSFMNLYSEKENITLHGFQDWDIQILKYWDIEM